MDPQRKNLLSFGFVREYCNDNDIELIPNDIIELFILWLSFCDKFEPDLCDKNIKIMTQTHDKYGEYQQISLRAEDDYFTAICRNVIKKGQKVSWKFQVSGRSTILGIIDDKVASATNRNFRDFSLKIGAYGLYFHDMSKYLEHSSDEQDIFKYGEQFIIKNGDTITMELDLTKELGVLSFIFDCKMKKQTTKSDAIITNIFYDRVDVNKEWRAAVATRKFQSIAILS